MISSHFFIEIITNSISQNLHRVDECNGWADSQGVYRYHIYPTCLASCEFGTESDIVGVALDGFPIYGPIDDNGQQLTS